MSNPYRRAETPPEQRARELARELRANGFDDVQLIDLATQLLAQVTERLGREGRIA